MKSPLASRFSRRSRSARLLAASGAGLLPVLTLISMTPAATAADISKADTGTNLSLAAAYAGGVLPGPGDRISFDATAATAANLTALTFDATAAANLSILGIVVVSPGGPVTINNQPQNVAGSTFNLGASGIDMTAATQNLTINAGISLSASQAFDVASGRTLTLGASSAQAGLSLLTNVLTVQGSGATNINELIYGSGSITKNGAGTLTLSTGSGSGNGQNTGSFFGGGINQSAGTINISGVNSAGTGAISVTGGTMTISQSQFLLTNGATVNGGTLNVNANVGIAGGTVTLTSGTLSSNSTNAFQYVTVAANGGTFIPNATSTIGALSGSTGFSPAAGTLTFGSNNATATYTGNIGGAVASNVVKTGSGTQTLNGTNATTGTITVNGSGGTLEIGNVFATSTNVAVQSGTLRLNFATNNVATNLIGSAPLSLSGGTLAVVGQNTATNVVQNFTGTTTTAGTNSNVGVINGSSTGTAAVNIGAITRGAGSVINFSIPGTPSATNGVLTTTGPATGGLFVGTGNQAYTTLNGTDFAAKDAGNTFVVPLTGSVTATGGTSLTGTPTDNADITSASVATSAASAINTVRFNNPGGSTVTLGGALTVTQSGILVSSAVTSPGSRITGGSITSGTDVIIHQFSAQPFTLNSPVTGGSVILTKAGPGTLVLTAANTNGGITYINSGTLQIGTGGSMANSIVNLAPNDPTAVLDVNNQSTAVSYVGSGGTTGGYISLGRSGSLTINSVGGQTATFSGALVGGVGSVITRTATAGALTATQGFQGNNSAFYGTFNLNTGTAGIFGGTGLLNATFNNNGGTFNQGGAGTTVFFGNLGGTGGTLVGAGNASATGTYNFGYLGGASSYAGVIANGTNATPGLTSIGKFGSGTTTLSGTNTYTGTTTINSGGLTFDYSTGGTPLPTGSTLNVGGGTATFRGAATGAATAISTGTYTNSGGQLDRVTLDANGNANGVAVTLKTAVINGVATLGTTTAANSILFDTSSSAANVLRTDVAIGAAGFTAADTIGIRTNNGLLVSGNTNNVSYRSNILLRDSTGTGFATTSGTSIIRNNTFTSLNGNTAGTLAEDGTANYLLTADLTRTTPTFLYNTLTLDTSANPVTLIANNIDNFTRFGNGSGSTSGRGVLAVGSNGATIRADGGTNQPTYFNNYQTGTTAGQTLTVNIPLFGTTYLNGTGLTVLASKVNTGDLYIQSGVVRETLAQSSGDALTPGAGVIRLTGGILEIGAHLTGTTSATSTADFSRSVGAVAGQVQLVGDTGFSAFGGNRTVNLGGVSSLLVWGQDNFLVSPSGNNVEGNQTFRLSSAFSDSRIDFQNPIALGSITRQVDVANGSAAVDARLSGVLSGVAPLTVVTANGNPAILNAAAGLTKLGLGTLELTGANTYRGQTTISAGTLLVNNTTGSGTGSGAVVVNTGILGGSGTINVGANTVAVNTGGTLSPGNSPGILTVIGTQTTTPTAADGTATLNLNTGSNLLIELNGTTPGTTYDQVNLIGTLALNGGTLTLSLGFTPPANSMFVIVNNDGTDTVFGTFAGLANGSIFSSGGQTFSINYNGVGGVDGIANDIILTAVVPEPSTYALLGLGLGGLGLAAARRRRQSLAA